MRLFKCESSKPIDNAQRNLMGRTHYVDSDTLRWHKSRVLSARHTDHGLLFAIVTSDAIDMGNTKRGFRYVIFDIFGTVLARPNREEAFKRRETCEKAMWKRLETIDAKAHTLEAINHATHNFQKEMSDLTATVSALEYKTAA